MKPGTFIKSTALLDDSVFENTVILLVEYNEKGALGFICNQLFPRTLNELEEFKHLRPFPIRTGGPVDQEHLYFVHRRTDLIEGGEAVTDKLFFGGDFKAVVAGIATRQLTTDDLVIFIGYCGWDHAELEEEIAEGSWEVLEEVDLFNSPA